MENGKDYILSADAGQVVVSSNLTSAINEGDKVKSHTPTSHYGKVKIKF